jgi:endo-1,4-beta-xylanase
MKNMPTKIIYLSILASMFVSVCTLAKDQDSLQKVYQDSFKMGVALNQEISSGEDKNWNSLITTHFNSITPENVMKAERINPEPNVFNFKPADDFVAFGKKNKQFIVGHTLVWHNQTPAWFFINNKGEPNTPEQQIERMRVFIETVAGRYKGKVHAWDVVNEVIGDDGQYRTNTAWVKTVGDGDTLVKNAFQYAQQYAPDAELYYNDFNAWRPAKRDGIVRMVKMLQANGIRIDGIGMQGHWGLNYPKKEYIEAAIDAYAALGIKVMITELDIDVLPLTREGQIIGTGMLHPQFQEEEFEEYLDPYKNGLPADVQTALTQRYQELFDIFYKKRDKIDRVAFWGIHDGMNWKNDYPIAGRTNYPLMWNRDGTAKPALDAILNLPQSISANATTVNNFTRMPKGSCFNQPPSGDLTATRIETANTTRTEAGLYEGPVWINNALYFSDFTFAEDFPSRIQKLDASGKMSVFIDNSGSNGLAADAQGNLVAGTHKYKSLSKYTLNTKERKSVAEKFNGNPFNSPNDLAITKDGTIYFTDPNYQASAALGGQDKTRVYRVATNGDVTVVDYSFVNPNGISLSPDEETLYVVGNESAGELRQYKIVNNIPQKGTTLVKNINTPDGMTVDCAGNLYVTEHVEKRVRVFTPQGQQIASIKVDANVTNVAFGGPNNKTLFITGAGAVWKIDLAISGAAY